MENDLLNRQRKLLIFTAKSLFRAEFYTNALSVMKNAIDMDTRLSPKRRKFFFDIVRAIVSPMRSTLSQLNENIIRETRERQIAVVSHLQDVYASNYSDLEITCQDILSIVNQQLIPGNSDAEAKVEFMRLQGDLCRYVYEFAPEERKEFYMLRCKSVYSDAYKIASAQLPPHSIARLALVLNLSMFLAESARDVHGAVELAESEVNKLLAANSELSEALFQKAMVFARKLRDKIITWKE
ncbi:14-3-3 protein 1 [Tritrichomonas foetus]|uniref:14-3-3 protein 1 n=1 Tax=Tritrichomonas foetus TaxID=1144522 RepID=A0A1J4K2N2_9EUKA|nr:14-3-3 protein 1 [Tritrichomonas foetus]|eukprot:OHT05226.1 14-3-3 protein 1 [Tritrichomonas foetus]